MDRNVNIRFYEVRAKEKGAIDFGKALEQINRLPLAEREVELGDDLILRVEKINIDDQYIRGEIIRIQSRNLPAKALRGSPRDKLNVKSIGHSSVFRFSRKTNVLAIQLARNGITAMRFVLYVSALLDIEKHVVWPVLTKDAWKTLRSHRVRTIVTRVADPENLDVGETEYAPIKKGFTGIRSLRPPTGWNADLNQSLNAA